MLIACRTNANVTQNTMASSTIPRLALIFLWMQGLTSLDWNPNTRHQYASRACSGLNLTLTWHYLLAYGEHVTDIKWQFAPPAPARADSMLIATYNPKDGLFVSASYGSRLHRADNASLVLAEVTSADAGSYTAEVRAKDWAGLFSSVHNTVSVHVAEPSSEGWARLTVDETGRAVYSNTTGQLHVQLACGPLFALGQPPLDVIWTTPLGSKVASSSYDNGYFYLLLDNPVKGGNYSCRLPPSAPEALCLRSDDPLLGETHLQVDDVAARLSLLEANEQALSRQVQEENQSLREKLQQAEFYFTSNAEELKELKDENSGIREKLSQTESRLAADTDHLTAELKLLQEENRRLREAANRRESRLAAETDHLREVLEETRADVIKTNVTLKDNVSTMMAKFDVYRNKTSTHVIFHAKLGKNRQLNYGEHVRFQHVYFNDGGAYDNNTGDFTAPLAGSYFFTVTTTPFSSGHYSSCYIVVDGKSVASVVNKFTEYYDMATGHAAVHLEKGRKVWVQSNVNSQFYFWSLFSGFLVQPDW